MRDKLAVPYSQLHYLESGRRDTIYAIARHMNTNVSFLPHYRSVFMVYDSLKTFEIIDKNRFSMYYRFFIHFVIERLYRVILFLIEIAKSNGIKKK